ncbi:hypothetical protein KC363_g3975 [Hortaea werneckii]|uniref:Uncharacterized protein n=1 Tax=Hortaea werneckii TaxID=91943 RepID=A0A3M7G1B8_HORWE|nr:hypothetical protein KC363_g3975 [Hortaea werneckii]RMY94697.1 hypothetical protein D0861_01138 [Hortaea werneckii]
MQDIKEGAEEIRKNINRQLDKPDSTSGNMPEKGVTGAVTTAVTTVTGTLGAAVGGVSRTVGGVVGAAGRGVGGTINNTTGTKAAGYGLQALTDGVEGATNSVAKGIENGSQGKKAW